MKEFTIKVKLTDGYRPGIIAIQAESDELVTRRHADTEKIASVKAMQTILRQTVSIAVEDILQAKRDWLP